MEQGESCESFDKIGPWLVTRDEVADRQDLSLWLIVNGATMQDVSTQTMVYFAARVTSYLSRFITLHTGDIISTGTPPGVDMRRKPRRYLEPGDVVELGIVSLARQRQHSVAER